MLEHEIKIPLTAEEFLLLCEAAGPVTCVRQVNYYYDTDGYAMDRAGITCRIRERNGKYTATVKEHCRHTDEASIEISMPAADELDASLFKGRNVALKGALQTERHYLTNEKALEIVLDKNTYLGIVDYELEIEYATDKRACADAALAHLADVLRARIQHFDSTEFRARVPQSKSRRFFRALRARREGAGIS